MKRLEIKLENCHGVRQLDATLPFKNGRAVAIYSPNGTMKTSFARTFADHVEGAETIDRMFPERKSSRSIKDGEGADLDSDDVVVVMSYDEKLGPTEATSTLLVNQTLRIEFETLQTDVHAVRDDLVAALKGEAKTKRDVAALVSQAFMAQEGSFFEGLVRIQDEIKEQHDISLASVPYEVIFDPKVQLVLRNPGLQASLGDYVTRLNELLDESDFFNRDSFSFYKATNVTKSLGDNGFFTANHSLLLNGDVDGSKVISSKADLDQLIADETARITSDDDLRNKFEVLEKALNRNAQTREFFSFISDNVALLPELTNIDLFEQKLWKAYIKSHEELYVRALDVFLDARDRKKEIRLQAAAERTLWERVIQIFNERFFVPFKLKAINRDSIVLGQDKLLQLEFEFDDGEEKTPVERDDLLQVLSNGEKKAFYILNVLFEVETRKALARDTLFVIDDIADSFDYKNKYAIIHYLKEMSDQPNFRLILLTHNFDFFRTLESRSVVRYDHCFMAQKGNGKVTMTPAEGIKNPFIKNFKPAFFDDGMKRIACIPFIRNILEYTKGADDPDYLKLTSLLHWKPDTETIDNPALDAIFMRVFGGSGAWTDQSGSVVDLITSQADLAIGADEGVNFENKIVLSIAIRLLSERHMIAALADPDFTNGIQASQTQALFQPYKVRDIGTPETRSVLDSVVLMTPENLHVNSFMYEPIIDMSDMHLRQLYQDVKRLNSL